MALKVLGLRKTWSHNSILGISDEETVKLDFDEMPFSRVKYWASWALKRFKLQGFIILKSSKNCYHVIFDRTVSWVENMSVVAWVALLSHNEGLKRYLIMQCIKKCSTVRVSAKNEKSSPIVVYRCGNQSENVREFLKNRRLIKKITRKMQEKS
jgi:hypothetical protein